MDSSNDKQQRKDRLIQTRVPQNLESTLKDEARKRRLSVSHLIRNVLEDTFDLVDNVVHEVDRVVSDSVGVAHTLRRDAQRLAATARGETEHRKPRQASEPAAAREPSDSSSQPQAVVVAATPAEQRGDIDVALEAVYAFQELVLNRPVPCARCEQPLGRGVRAYLGLVDAANVPRLWICHECIEALD